MKKNWLRLIGAIALVLGLTLTGCSGNETNESAKEKASVEENAQEEQHIVVKIQDGDKVIAEKEIEIEEGNNLLNIMKEHFSIEEKDKFITSIEGVSQNEEEGKYWIFEINGEPVMEGAHLTEVKNNDEVVWELKQFN